MANYNLLSKKALKGNKFINNSFNYYKSIIVFSVSVISIILVLIGTLHIMRNEQEKGELKPLIIINSNEITDETIAKYNQFEFIKVDDYIDFYDEKIINIFNLYNINPYIYSQEQFQYRKFTLMFINQYGYVELAIYEDKMEYSLVEYLEMAGWL